MSECAINKIFKTNKKSQFDSAYHSRATVAVGSYPGYKINIDETAALVLARVIPLAAVARDRRPTAV